VPRGPKIEVKGREQEWASCTGPQSGAEPRRQTLFGREKALKMQVADTNFVSLHKFIMLCFGKAEAKGRLFASRMGRPHIAASP